MTSNNPSAGLPGLFGPFKYALTDPPPEVDEVVLVPRHDPDNRWPHLPKVIQIARYEWEILRRYELATRHFYADSNGPPHDLPYVRVADGWARHPLARLLEATRRDHLYRIGEGPEPKRLGPVHLTNGDPCDVLPANRRVGGSDAAVPGHPDLKAKTGWQAPYAARIRGAAAHSGEDPEAAMQEKIKRKPRRRSKGTGGSGDGEVVPA